MLDERDAVPARIVKLSGAGVSLQRHCR